MFRKFMGATLALAMLVGATLTPTNASAEDIVVIGKRPGFNTDYWLELQKLGIDPSWNLLNLSDGRITGNVGGSKEPSWNNFTKQDLSKGQECNTIKFKPKADLKGLVKGEGSLWDNVGGKISVKVCW